MRPVVQTVSSLANSTPIPLDTYQDPFNVSVAAVLSGGASLTYTVQHTFDDVFAKDFDPSTATWFNHASLASKTTSSDGNYAFPVRAVRISVGAYTSGSVTFTVIQAGMPGR